MRKAEALLEAFGREPPERLNEEALHGALVIVDACEDVGRIGRGGSK